MIHQVLSGVKGQATDIEITAKHVLKLRDDYADVLAESTSKDRKTLLEDIERDNWLDAKQAKEYGIIDMIMDPKHKK